MATTGKSSKKAIEQYDHKGKQRVNNPPVGLVTPDTDQDADKKIYAYDPHIDPHLQFDSQGAAIEALIDKGLAENDPGEIRAVLEELKKRRQPYLNWSGKAERTTFEVPTVSLHVHERIDPRSIIEAVRKRNGVEYKYKQMSLFECREENPPLREAIEFYKHKHNWSNRLIAGDSLLVMNSLLEKEGLAGQVQMIYIDPPYGIKYGSNFQPFVNKRDVKDGKDEDLTQEPEMIKAFRDTWELGIHSYLTYLRDRLLLARELLRESGSVFVQIGEENIHHVRELMDEIFGSENFISQISFRTTGGRGAQLIDKVINFLVWYGKNIQDVSKKYNQLFIEKSSENMSNYDWIETIEGNMIQLTQNQIDVYESVPVGRRYQLTDLTSQGESKTGSYVFNFEKEKFVPRHNRHWSTTLEGMNNLVNQGRIQKKGKNIFYRRYYDDYPVRNIDSSWNDTAMGGFLKNEDKIYVVQTPIKVISRCILMTTDPGDLVFDPTCGSGTTAYCAEKWGRRWITCDTSRVAITLAKQRLMTSVYDYYELAQSNEGVGSGFNYKTVPHITLRSIANNIYIKKGMTREQIDEAIARHADRETLYDQPFIDKSKTRVSGPFTMEAVPSPVVKPLSDIDIDQVVDNSIARSGETLRQSEWRDELFKTGIRAKSGQKLEFTRIEPISGARWLHAEGETKEDEPKYVVISFGPEHSPLDQRQVSLALDEAEKLRPKPKIIVFASFHFDPEAAKDIDETRWPGVTLLKAQMNTDLLTDDLKKKRSSNESFWLIGQPEVKVDKITQGKDKGKYRTEVLGFDYYNPQTGAIESGGVEKIAVWMLDYDYDGRSIYPKQVFFPLADEKGGWTRLAKNLKAEIDPELIEAYRGTVSLPFEKGDNQRIAVKIVDDRGIESLKIMELD